MSSDQSSAVIIKKTGEVLNPEDYYINGTETANESKAIFVCRERFNCSKNWRRIDEGEFLVFENKSILINASKKLYEKSEYIWRNHAVLICDNVSVFDGGLVFDRNCSGEWGLMESHEFTILTNQSIYVNASETLYDPTQYIWQNQSLFVCDNFTTRSSIYFKKSWSNNEQILSVLTFVCMSMSIISLVFVLVTYSLFTELRTQPGINLMNLSAAILLAQLLWLLGSGQTDNSMGCTAIAVLLHYFFLVSFVWTSIIAFDTWRAFTAKGRRSIANSKQKRRLNALRYMAVGWLSVLVYVSICVALDQSQTVAIGFVGKM
ncbi:Cadherin EGF LAG seven-pass G-type receptor 2 [Exaiptasia diaphana]|nr:Cadherin EGF LAG seven-pass G-type receptor 2 [Exaiptasia diaphana]